MLFTAAVPILERTRPAGTVGLSEATYEARAELVKYLYIIKEKFEYGNEF